MFKFVAWAITGLILTFLVWQSTAIDPLWPRYVSSVLLATIGLLAGLRMGADSSAKYIKDLQRLNKVLAEQNRDLQDVNAFLLEKSNGGPTVRSKSG